MEFGHISKAFVRRIKTYTTLKEEEFLLGKDMLATLPIPMNITFDNSPSIFLRSHHFDNVEEATGDYKTQDCRVFPHYLF
ncbi:MAG: hypothetical protein GWO20_13260 [Candidatus Korarchaeota archaeon]|nr:hypothetical protein [Candidatus Korarchaeota archaeon]NIU84363.1 hypothetical protein [Candidatus Thorarchaeota archaeon]NIW14479.1 hypothetical protein [Candidatus Thorarchaeota archaeon]NIW52556.1 hypothetical protein [Candidatus Korarchaeota archaeon]